MVKLLLNKHTAAEANRLADSPSQFLILTGSPGSGKKALALELGSKLFGSELTTEHPALLQVSLQPNKSEISIDQVRQTISNLKLTSPGKGNVRRILLIEDGQYLSEEAQNALLKTLEEPPADTQIFLTVDSASSLLPTIMSRGQILEVKPVDLAAAKKFFADISDDSEVEKAWLLADGSVGLMSSLLGQSDTHELKTAVTDAKKFIAASKYQRLARANEFNKNRRQVELLIEGLRKVIKTVQRQTILNDKPTNQKKITQARKQLDELSDALRANVSPKTIYLKLCLNLGI
jgi:DNA polymerase-3 subunit delta'